MPFGQAHDSRAARAGQRKHAGWTVKSLYWDEAAQALCRRDRVLRRLIRAYPDIHLKRRSDPFTTLARAIVGQQISVKAADAIWKRFVAVVDRMPARGIPCLAPARVAAAEFTALRTCGLSQRKAEYLRDLALHFASGRLDPKRWKKLDDEALIAELVDVKGIGRWTAEMFLMFHELRPTCCRSTTSGCRTRVAVHYNGGERLPREAMLARCRSVAAMASRRNLVPVAHSRSDTSRILISTPAATGPAQPLRETPAARRTMAA